MNDLEHFFDMEIKRAEDCIANDWVECFNGVEVGNEIAKKLNREHIVFCKNVKKSLANYENSRESKIAEMQSHIDCLKTELEEVQMNKPELPDEPIKVAEMLIYATYKRTNCMTGKEYDKELYELWELKQIAEHLLVYCNHAEVE